MWLLFSFLSAFTQASYLAVAKRLTKNLSPNVLGSGGFFAALPFLAGYGIIFGWPELNGQFYIGAIGTVGINIIALIFLYRGLANTDLSVGAPIFALTPIFALPVSFFILGESPSILGGVGVVIAVLGFMIVAHEHRKKDCSLEEEIKSKKQRKGIIFLMITAFLYSISVNFDKMASANSTPFFATSFILTFMGLGMLLIAIGKKETKHLKRKDDFLKLFLLGFINLIAVFVWYVAILGGLVVYSVAIKRLSVLIGILYGYFWFKEKNIRQKFAGAVVVLIGLFFVIFFK